VSAGSESCGGCFVGYGCESRAAAGFCEREEYTIAAIEAVAMEGRPAVSDRLDLLS